MKQRIQTTPWLRRIREWFQLKELERELRKSRDFQKVCEGAGCLALADLEQSYQEGLIRKIHEKKVR